MLKDVRTRRICPNLLSSYSFLVLSLRPHQEQSRLQACLVARRTFLRQHAPDPLLRKKPFKTWLSLLARQRAACMAIWAQRHAHMKILKDIHIHIFFFSFFNKSWTKGNKHLILKLFLQFYSAFLAFPNSVFCIPFVGSLL